MGIWAIIIYKIGIWARVETNNILKSCEGQMALVDGKVKSSNRSN